MSRRWKTGRGWWLLTVLAALTTAPVVIPGPDESGAQVLRNQADQFSKTAEALRAQGHTEDADRFVSRAEELLKRAQTIESRSRQKTAVSAAPTDPPAESPPPTPAAQTNQVAAPQRSAGLKRATAPAVPRTPDLAAGSRTPDRVGQSQPQPAPINRHVESAPLMRAETARQLAHLDRAITSLHAACRHDLAEQLAREAETLRQSLLAAASPSPESEEIRRLKGELDDLRSVVESMRRQLGEPTPELTDGSSPR